MERNERQRTVETGSRGDALCHRLCFQPKASHGASFTHTHEGIFHMDQTQTYAANQTVVGYFDKQDRAEAALNELRDAGFTSAHLGVAHRGHSMHTTGSKAKHAGESMWDRIKNFFEGSPEPYAEERKRPDMGTREITDPNSPDYNRNTSSYDYDDVHHSLTGMQVPEYRSRYFRNKFRSNEDGALVTVNAGTRVADAERILRDNGADLGDSATEAADYPNTSSAERTAAYSSQTPSDTAATDYNAGQARTEYADARRPDYTGTSAETEDLQNMQLLGEVLRVHKDRVSRGEVVVRKNVVNDTQTVQVPVTRDEFVMERRAATGDAPASGTVGEGQEIRIPLTEETASIDKGTVVREDVTVGKKPVQEIRDLSGDVRREELEVDDRTTKRAVNE